MSGGTAYVWDVEGDFRSKCNLGMVELEPIQENGDMVELLELIEQHQEYTGSTVARDILDRWPDILTQFVKVMPIDYKRVLAERARHNEEVETKVHREAEVQTEPQTGPRRAVAR
jgi:glutamate synthase domain-containing protein 3